MADGDLDLDAFLEASDELVKKIEADKSNTQESEAEAEASEPVQTEDELKKLGNDAFSNGNNTLAVEYYSKAIKLNPKNHVLWSNRSASRLKLGENEKALEDATECVRLNPVWGKGHGRKGAALYALGRFDEALNAYSEGLTVDKSNTTLSEGKEKCSRALKESQAAGLNSEQQEKARLQEVENDEDFKIFMDQVSRLDPNQVPKELKVTAVDHEAETSGWTSSNQLDRILCHRYKWLNLNPFRVFGLAHNANEEDIKKRYRKLSALVHPDKNRDGRAQDAFEEVKKAYEKLKNEEAREVVIRTINQVTKKVVLTRNRLKKKGLTEAELVKRDGTLDEAIDKAMKVEFATQEHERNQSAKNRRTYEHRERKQDEEKQKYWRGVKATEETMREGREVRAKSWQSFNKRKKQKAGSTDGQLEKKGRFN